MAAKSKDAKAMIAAAAESPEPAPDMRRPKATDAAKAGAYLDVKPLPDDCPVVPLGHLAGMNYVLDHAGQLRPLTADCRKGEIMMLFGHPGIPWLVQEYPHWVEGKDEPYVKGFNQTHIQEALIMACSRKGLFNPAGRERGRGAHPGSGGELVLHCGDSVWIAGERTLGSRKVKPMTRHATGLFGRFVYPSYETIDPPAQTAAPREMGEDILALVRKWRWKDPVFALLIVGFIVAAPIGGALPWRPHMWIVGPSGAGKSTLHLVIRKLMGPWALTCEDATEAGLRQTLNQDTLGVLFDEFEPSETNKGVMDKIVRLARLASSGASTLRGSSDHKAATFVARSCFLFSSIQYHALEAQDRNRMAIVTLSKIPQKTAKVEIPAALEDWGHQLRRRVADQWYRFADTLAAYQKKMFELGFSAREQDTYGVLLACADLALHDSVPDPLTLTDDALRVEEYVSMLAPSLDSSRGEAEDQADRCLRRLSSHRLRSQRDQDGKQVATWIGEAFADVVNNQSRGSPAFDKLLNHGMMLVHPPDDPKSESAGARAYLHTKDIHIAIAGKDHAGIAEIYERSLWEGGMWAQTLATLPGARASKKARLGAQVRCVTVPIGEFIDVKEWEEEAYRQLANAKGAE
ncbi:hypothetical protein [Sphingopyxis sp. SCN 67-31]|mgnify:CR=1 FL=1|uniref:hypothetical protein n=1 Tax=Sphingopyxis sp. SCN 67-31 TaxID=1660142 RepID=UPI00086D78E3|nr:hypothetical protein [Sphingopyxis sp. SCN 67-31]ODU29003.1 MAG: hypothetical protein ABS88_10760 [Sphingopyxis sp. SCN 67-31]